jgi:hypothetical protein
MWNLIKSTAAAGLLGLTALQLQVVPTQAADMYDRYGPRAASPYDDPRYADIYTHPQPPRRVEPRYVEPRYVEPGPVYQAPRYERPYAHQDEQPPRDRYGYLKPINPPHYRQGHATAPACVHHSEIRRALVGEGWRDFQDLEFRGEVAVVRARRPNGQLYSLKVDRCTGEIVNARPLDDGRVPYAHRERYGERTY